MIFLSILFCRPKAVWKPPEGVHVKNSNVQFLSRAVLRDIQNTDTDVFFWTKFLFSFSIKILLLLFFLLFHKSQTSASQGLLSHNFHKFSIHTPSTSNVFRRTWSSACHCRRKTPLRALNTVQTIHPSICWCRGCLHNPPYLNGCSPFLSEIQDHCEEGASYYDHVGLQVSWVGCVSNQAPFLWCT